MSTNFQYQTYVLRCWAEEGGGPDRQMWRFLLQDTDTGEKTVFPSKEALLDHLAEMNWDEAVAVKKE